MRFAAWEAQMAKPADDGQPTRAHLTAAAQRGSPFARKTLMPPEIPLVVEYLWDWFTDLRRGLGEGLSGPAPVTWTAIAHWKHRCGVVLEWYEEDALLSLDAAARNPDAVLETA